MHNKTKICHSKSVQCGFTKLLLKIAQNSSRNAFNNLSQCHFESGVLIKTAQSKPNSIILFFRKRPSLFMFRCLTIAHYQDQLVQNWFIIWLDLLRVNTVVDVFWRRRFQQTDTYSILVMLCEFNNLVEENRKIDAQKKCGYRVYVASSHFGVDIMTLYWVVRCISNGWFNPRRLITIE